MNESVKAVASRVVNRLLNDDTAVQEYNSQDDFDQRAGGEKDPFRQTKGPIPRASYKGKRPGMKKIKADKVLEPDDLKDKPTHPRWAWKPNQHECKSAVGTPSKAWKQGKASKGKPVAGKPGKLSYKESLIRHVLENIKVKKAMKMGKSAGGKSVSKGPGKVSYRGEAKTVFKGLGKKKPASVACAPGKVCRGKR